MAKKKKIFILYARFGDGHWQAATALRQSFECLGRTEVKLIDLLAESHPVLNEVSRFVYNKSYNLLPQVYGWVYDATKGMKSDSLFANWLHSFGALTLRKLMEQERPDAIIHTFPTLVLPFIARKSGYTIPMYNVVTDFDLHRRWVHPEVDKYYVATEDISVQLSKLGVHSDRIAATGIPIRPTFLNGMNAKSIFARYGLSPERPIALIMAAPNVPCSETAEMCRSLSGKCRAQVIVVCGRNRALYDELSEIFSFEPSVLTLGFVERIDELMAVSSCIVTKPGGLTLSEAIAAQLPILLYRPVPGQELGNARYLESKGAAVICRSVEHLSRSVAELLQVPSRRIAMRNALKFLSKKNASDNIALDIERQLHIMEEASVATASPSDSVLVPT
ncbi:diacylglycerol glucosyltransferase [Cohnella endophytica]|uniref:Diacylglycerol glucosyltransferase n=1 Tax=Cohnella endophytica TaxID=2419778 RepID=A0A494XK49_9BACL|nr:glycosyltransferase [Cohnella endophytica]RKP50112.1 diacylglycerol glucosyltransferase [Cohnella endophytica]